MTASRSRGRRKAAPHQAAAAALLLLQNAISSDFAFEEARVRTAVPDVVEQDVIAAVDALVQSLHTERQRLARRLDDMERQLLALNGKLNASEPRLGDVRSHANLR